MSAIKTTLPDGGASIRRIAAAELLERVQYFGLDPPRVLLLGHELRYLSESLRTQFGRADLISVDAAAARSVALDPGSGWWPKRLRQPPPMAQALRARPTALPLQAASIDLSYMNLLLPACPEPDQALRELSRVMRPGALLLFASLGPGSLPELHELRGVFLDLPQLGDLLQGCGFAEPVMDIERHQIRYASCAAFDQELEQLSLAESPAEAGALTLTFELIIAAAFASGTQAPSAGGSGGGEVLIPVSSLRRRHT